MARRVNGLGNIQSEPKVGRKISVRRLDYHEGLSYNQVKIILAEFGFGYNGLQRFNKWMYGQTCPVIKRYNRETEDYQETGGVYEWDLFRWIENQKKGTPLIWD